MLPFATLRAEALPMSIQISILGCFAQINHQLIQLLLIYEARSAQHHIATLIVLWERNAVTNAVQSSEQAHEAIQAVCQTAVRWRTELEGIHEEAELQLCLFWCEAQDLEGALLQSSIVDTDTTATNLYTVDNHVVCVRTHSSWIGVHQRNILWFWRGKWMVHSHKALLLVAPLVHWEVHDPEA